ncbi:MAG: hypothetical protein M3Q58_03650 [Bacteroidota bacterium]|nr:hypothetical protein [Bacteroidota bacterium]
MTLIPTTFIATSSGDTKPYFEHHVACIRNNYTSLDNKNSCALITELGFDGYVLKSSLNFNVSRENNEFLASYEQLGIFEYSDSYESLLNDVKAYIVDLYDELTSTVNAKLSPELQKQKKFLKKIILTVKNVDSSI